MRYLKISGFSCAGARGSNQDNILLDKYKKPSLLGSTYIYDPVKININGNLAHTFAVADGIGGMADGEKAALQTINYIYKNRARGIRSGFWDALNRSCIKKYPCSGCTLAVCRIKAEKDKTECAFYSLGDSLIYLIRGGNILLANRVDNRGEILRQSGDSAYSKQDMQAADATVTEYIGKRYANGLPMFSYVSELEDGDKIIVASDGIKCLDPGDIILSVQRKQFGDNPAFSVANAALEKSGKYADNITAIVLEFWEETLSIND